MKYHPTTDALQQLKNMLFLSSLSYDIIYTQIYMPKTSEKEIFSNITNYVQFVPCGILKIIALRSKDSKTLYVAIANTREELHVEYNQVFPRFEKLEKIKFNSKYFEHFLEVKEEIKIIIEDFVRNGGTEVWLTGHSSGGSIASITAYYIEKILNIKDIKVVTFGAPPFTNYYGSKWYENKITYTRVDINKDPIPDMESTDGYERYFHIYSTYLLIKNKCFYLKKTYTSSGCSCINLLPILYNHKIGTYKNKLNNILN